MTNAGWYPDPAGTPGAYRYWDGQQWGEHTTTDPYGAGAGPAATQVPPPAPSQPSQPSDPYSAATAVPPPPPGAPGAGQGGYGGPGGPGPAWTPTPAGSGGSGAGGGKGKLIGIIVAAVLVLVLLGVAAFFGVRALTGDDDPEPPGPTETTGGGDSTDPTDDSTDDSTDDETDAGPPGETATPTTQQCEGGLPTVGRPQGGDTITGGGLEMPTLAEEGYIVEQNYAEGFTFAEQFTPIYKVIEQTETSGWVSTAGVGGLLKRNGFEDPEQAAGVVMSCTAASPALYTDLTGRTDLDQGAITVDGRPAYQITSELRVDQPEIQAEGDVVQVVVVDTGDERTFGLYIMAVPIGDTELLAVQEELLTELEVED